VSAALLDAPLSNLSAATVPSYIGKCTSPPPYPRCKRSEGAKVEMYLGLVTQGGGGEGEAFIDPLSAPPD
jgi:hypothetical protein